MNVKEMSSEQLQERQRLINEAISQLVDNRLILTMLGCTIREFSNAAKIQLEKLYALEMEVNLEIKKRLTEGQKQIQIPFMFEDEF